MKLKGLIASKINVLQKGGAMFKVALPELGDTFPVYQEVAAKGIETLIMLDEVYVEFDSLYPNKQGLIQLQGVVVTPVIKEASKLKVAA